MTDEKAKAIVTAVYAGNQWEVMQELPENARCAEVNLLITMLCEEVRTIEQAAQILGFDRFRKMVLQKFFDGTQRAQARTENGGSA